MQTESAKAEISIRSANIHLWCRWLFSWVTLRPESCNVTAIARKVTCSATGLFNGLIPLKIEADFRAARPVMTPWPRRRFTGSGTLCPRMPNLATPPKRNRVGIYINVLGKDGSLHSGYFTSGTFTNIFRRDLMLVTKTAVIRHHENVK